MTREQAHKEGRKRWGVKAIVRAYGALSSPERRSEARGQFETAKARIEAIDAEIKERLAALDWYKALTEERRAMVAQKQANIGAMSYYKFQVGRDSMGIAFAVEGQGDTWEEAFAKADKDRKAVTA